MMTTKCLPTLCCVATLRNFHEISYLFVHTIWRKLGKMDTINICDLSKNVEHQLLIMVQFLIVIKKSRKKLLLNRLIPNLR